MGGGAGIAGGLLNARNVRRDFTGPESRLLDVACNLLRRRALFFHGPGNPRGDFAHFIDRRGDLFDGAYGFTG